MKQTQTWKCTQCGQEKLLCEFNVDRRAKSKKGHYTVCKKCRQAKAKVYLQEPQAKAARAWLAIRQRVRDNPYYRHVKIKMSKDEFLAWAIPQYVEWFAKRPGEKPSVDRIDSGGHYELSNIQMISMPENSRKAAYKAWAKFWPEPDLVTKLAAIPLLY